MEETIGVMGIIKLPAQSSTPTDLNETTNKISPEPLHLDWKNQTQSKISNTKKVMN